MTIKNPLTIIIDIQVRRTTARYEKMIAESQAKLAETTLVPGYTKIYA